MVVAQTSPAAGPKVARPKDPQRSAIANGKLLPGIDQRSSWVRRVKELIGDFVADLGGEANTSTAQHALIRRASTIVTELERLEVRFAVVGAAKPDDLDLYLRASNSLRRILESLGLRRQARDISPTLSDVLRGPPP